MDEDKYYEDYAIGEKSSSLGRTITETDIVIHSGQVGDLHPYHMDAEFSKNAPFGQRLAYGTLVFSIAAGFMARSVNNRLYSYGYDRIRFVKPVFIGDTIHLEMEIVEKRPSPKHLEHGFVFEQGTTINQRGEIVLVFTHIGFVERRVPAELEAQAAGVQAG
jgi:acyl dehydratase